MKPATRFLSVLILIAGSGSVTLADDTDIYLDPQTAGPPPMVMFSLDYRSNVTSTSCNHSTNTMEDIRDDCGFSELLAQILFDDNAGADEKISLYEMIRAALQVVVEDLDGVSVGLMMSHHDDNDCEGPGQTGCSNGAMIMQGFRPLEDGDANGNKAAFLALLRSIPDEPDPDAPDRQNVDYHPYQPKEMYFEFFRYLTGQAVYNGHNGWTDFDTGTDARNLAANAVADAAITAADPAADAFRELKHPGFTNTGSVTYPSWDETIEDAGHTEYVSPLAGNDCVSVFAINIGFGTDNNDADSDDAMALPIADGGLNLVFDESNEFAQLVRYMNDANFGDGTWPNIAEIDGEQNLISYFIMDSANSTQDEWADAGGTGQAIELGENPDVVVETINNIFKSILSVSTTFVAPSVPVNVFNRAQTVDEVFLALFEAEVTPLWSGNLKKIKIGTRDTVDGNGNAITVTELQDANGDQAIDVDGRLRRDALTFWTDAGTLPDPPLEEDEVVDKDGRAIKRGAAGQQIAGVAAGNPELTNATAGARQLYTEDIGNTAGITGDTDNSDQLMPLDATVEVATEVWQELAIDSGLSAAADYASATNDEQDEAIDNLEFARGLQDDGATPRDWMMADPLHSRPRTINYGIRTAGYNMDNPDIRIVIGTNEGYMRMFRNTTTGVPDPDTLNVQDGSETWAFMPRAAMPLLDRLHDLTVTDPKHPNSTDGAPVVLTNDVNNDGNLKSGDGDTAWVFFGMRRGGRNLYALDVSDPDTPKLKWVIEGGTTAGFDELSQTFSTPQLGKVRVSGTTIDVLIFGGGYNGDEDGDGDYATCAAIVSAPQRAACFELLGNDRKNRLTRYNRNLVAPAVPVVPIETDADDTDVAFLGDDDVGNAVFIVNADTGALVWKVRGEPANDTDVAYNSGTKTIVQGDMDASIPAEVAAVDTRGDTFIDRIYVGDTAGVVWRIDLRGLKDTNGDGTGDTFVIDEPNLWQVTKLFNGGRRDGADDIVQDRRFFNRVDVSQTRDSSGAYDAVIIGSGDREDPQGEEAENWFYVIKDRATTSGAPASTMLVHSDTDGDGTVEDLADLSSNCLQTDTEANCLNTATLQAQFRNGWRIKLPNSGEKNLAAALTVGGEVFFTTFTPEEPASVCGLSEGSGRFYALSLQDATAIRNFDTTNDGGGETFERSDTLGSGGIPVEVVPLGGGQILVQGQEVGENIVQAGVASGFRTYWHELPEL